MKSLIVVVLALVGGWAFGSELNVTKDRLTPEMRQSLADRGTATSDEVRGENYYGYDCWAYTTCLNGDVVSCTSTGASCRSVAYTAQGVLCEAWGSDGSYRYSTSSCY